MRTCPNPKCNYVIENENAKFCKKCGAKLSNDNNKDQLHVPNKLSNEANTVEDQCPWLDPPAVAYPAPKDGEGRNEVRMDGGGISLGPVSSSINTPKPSSYNVRNQYQKPKSDISLNNNVVINKNIFWAVKTCFKKYATFSGRASRSEYWYLVLFNLLIYIAFLLLIVLSSASDVLCGFWLLLYMLYTLVAFLPGIAVTVRRLHDTDKSGYNYFIACIPFVGPIILLCYLCESSDVGENKYGNPT